MKNSVCHSEEFMTKNLVTTLHKIVNQYKIKFLIESLSSLSLAQDDDFNTFYNSKINDFKFKK